MAIDTHRADLMQQVEEMLTEPPPVIQLRLADSPYDQARKIREARLAAARRAHPAGVIDWRDRAERARDLLRAIQHNNLGDDRLEQAIWQTCESAIEVLDGAR